MIIPVINVVEDIIGDAVGSKQIALGFIIAICKIKDKRYVGFDIGDTVSLMWWFGGIASFTSHDEQVGEITRIVCKEVVEKELKGRRKRGGAVW